MAAKRRHIPESARRRKLRHRYGITSDEYQAKFEHQGGACAICYEVKDYPLYVDHNHTTKEVRDLLCARCNTIVGSLESPLVEQAKKYVERHNEGKKDGSA